MSAPRKKAPGKRSGKDAKRRASQDVLRDEKGRFPKGVSGNPAGGKPYITHVRNLAREHTQKAVERLVQEIDAKEGRTAIAAAQAILDRGWGKPTQPHGGDDEAPPIRLDIVPAEVLEAMMPDERRAYIAALRAARARLGDSES